MPDQDIIDRANELITALALTCLAVVPAWLGFICGMLLGLVAVAVIEWRGRRL
jgi:hypothetical protein